VAVYVGYDMILSSVSNTNHPIVLEQMMIPELIYLKYYIIQILKPKLNNNFSNM
jgi:hypothetical protein